MSNTMRGWILGLILTAVTSLTLGLTLVWLNVERVNMAYGLQKMQKKLDSTTAHAAKLALEKENLTSPYRLRQEAEKMGMHPAVSGQIRRMSDSAADVVDALQGAAPDGLQSMTQKAEDVVKKLPQKAVTGE